MLGLFTIEATIKIKHIKRDELILVENTHDFGNGR